MRDSKGGYVEYLAVKGVGFGLGIEDGIPHGSSTTPTIPTWQCASWEQQNHGGAVLVTQTSNVVGAGAVVLVAGMKGELKLPARGVQGEKTPYTTLCRPG